MGLRLANLVPKDWERTPSKREPRLRREVRASMGMLIRDMIVMSGLLFLAKVIQAIEQVQNCKYWLR